MKQGIHPEYKAVNVKCSCGNEFQINSTGRYLCFDNDTASTAIYTGKQKVVDTGGRVDRFNKRFGALVGKK